jgi:hypothetical protein
MERNIGSNPSLNDLIRAELKIEAAFIALYHLALIFILARLIKR